MATIITLYSGSVGATGSTFSTPDLFDSAMMVTITKSGSGAITAKLVAGPNSSSIVSELSGIVVSGTADTRQITLNTPGLYYYPYIGGISSIMCVASGSANTSLLVEGQFLLKR